MGKTLIIPDIHHATARADAIVAHEFADKVIYLGDFQDHFHDTVEDARKTATWVKEKLQDPNNVLMFGNHDLSYMYPANRYAYCSGFEIAKSLAINDIMQPADWAKMKLFHVEFGILFSHAGVSTRLLNQIRAPKVLDKLEVWLNNNEPIVHSFLGRGEGHDLIEAGYSRGGRRATGGITWADHDIDMVPLVFPQIVGHTPHKLPRLLLRKPDTSHLQGLNIDENVDASTIGDNWWSLDIDTHLNHYATIEDGILRVFEIAWKRGEGINLLNEISYTFERFIYKLK